MEEHFWIKNQDKTSKEKLCKVEISNLLSEVFNDHKDVQQTQGKKKKKDDHKYFIILTTEYCFVFTTYSLA